MKKLLSIILSACILLMVIPFEAAAVDVSYPYYIDKISYNNGTVIVGKWNAGSRPVWVYSKDKIYAASLGCQINKPSKDATINNGLNGYFELYFNGCTDSSGICSAVHNSSINSAFNRGSAIRTSN